ncbi:hypothetical protein [Methanohalophilus profundi]|nr:hypothetical protein [Methanohalophilus profundi]
MMELKDCISVFSKTPPVKQVTKTFSILSVFPVIGKRLFENRE